MTQTQTGQPADASATDTAAGAVGPPAPPPRPVTPLVRRRIWADPRVRFWWMAAAVLLLVAVYFAVKQTWIWSREAWLIDHGVVVSARVDRAAGESVAGRPQPPGSAVEMSFDWQGERHHIRGYLADQREFIITGSEIPLRVHPDNPNIWTNRTRPASLAREMIGPAIILPAVLLVGLVSLVMHRRMLRIWQHGEAMPAVVVESRQTPIAPMSRVIRCTPSTGGDRRVISVFVPTRAARLDRGDALWLIAAPGRLDRALVAMLYPAHG